MFIHSIKYYYQKDDFQLNVIDIIAQDGKELAAYRSAFQQYKEAERRLSSVKEQISKAQETKSYAFQFSELDNAGW